MHNTRIKPFASGVLIKIIQDMSSDIYTYVFMSHAILLILFEGRLSGKQGKNTDLGNLLRSIKSKSV